jgi:hypothetical protein
MRSVRWIAALVLVAFATTPVVARADDMSDADMREQMQIMQQRMKRMEDKLRDAERRAPAAAPASDCFFCSIEFEGWIAASYTWNTRGFDGGVEGQDLGGLNSGRSPGPLAPFHGDHNSFSVDQVWMGMERPINENQRAGFRLDFLVGKTGELSQGGNDGFSGGSTDFQMFQAYIQYLAPIGEGVEFKFGKFATLIGAEVTQATGNFNITRGNLFNLFQPITNTGILATASFWEGGTTSVGFVNETRSFTSRDVDLNNDKAFVWQVGHQINDAMFVSFNGTTGDSDSGRGIDTASGDQETILDFVLTWDPTEKLSTWANVDYLLSECNNCGPGLTSGDFNGYGIAAAGRYALTERMGLSARIEWVDLDFVADDDFQVFGLTTTLDYMLTSNLVVRGEVRWDRATGDQNEFLKSDNATRGIPGSGQTLSAKDQILLGAEVIYTF